MCYPIDGAPEMAYMFLLSCQFGRAERPFLEFIFWGSAHALGGHSLRTFLSGLLKRGGTTPQRSTHKIWEETL
jgi:hypothetical protein